MTRLARLLVPLALCSGMLSGMIIARSSAPPQTVKVTVTVCDAPKYQPIGPAEPVSTWGAS